MATVDGIEAGHPILQREQTLAIVLAASEWPTYPGFHASPSFRHSAVAIVNYLRSSEGLNLSPRNMKVLIDSFDDLPEVLRQMRTFISDRRLDLSNLGTPVTDLLLYYVGHGGFGDRERFFLSIRATDASDPLATSITANSLGRLLRDVAGGVRAYLVLDCCFAASLVEGFMSDGPLGVAEAQLHDAIPPEGDALAISAGKLPSYGTALLCASASRERAMAPLDLPYTMFTGGLLDVLKNGHPDKPAWLSLNDMQQLVTIRLKEQFAEKAVLPEVHSPQQRMGRVDIVPLFRNPAMYLAARQAGEQRQAEEAPRREEEIRQADEAARRSPDELAVGTVLNGYRILGVLGRGWLGIIYRASDLLEQSFAIKEYFPRQFAMRSGQDVVATSESCQDIFVDYRKRFLAEARRLSTLGLNGGTAGVVQVATFFEANNTAYSVMELLTGKTLDNVLGTGVSLSPQVLVSLLRAILTSLARVHAAGFLHRNIKPSNILIPPDGQPVLIDFGSARNMGQSPNRLATDTQVTQVDSGHYSPIEQMMHGAPEGPWSDIYSVGGVAYRAIGGRLIDARARQQAVLIRTRDPLVSAVDVGRGRYPTPLLHAIDRALAVAANDRPQRVEDMLALLEERSDTGSGRPGGLLGWLFKRVGRGSG